MRVGLGLGSAAETCLTLTLALTLALALILTTATDPEPSPNPNPNQVGIVHGGVVPKGVHPREYLKLLELPEDEEAKGYKKKVMRYCSTYRHTGVIGH